MKVWIQSVLVLGVLAVTPRVDLLGGVISTRLANSFFGLADLVGITSSSISATAQQMKMLPLEANWKVTWVRLQGLRHRQRFR